MFGLLKNVRTTSIGAMGLSLALLSGCAINMPVPVTDPAPSADKFVQADAASTSLYFVDAQSAETKAKLVTGLIPMKPTYKDQPLDAAAWLARNTVTELAARGLPVKQATVADGATTVQIKLISSQNHRVSGFSPFETYTSLNADLITAKGPQRIAFWMKRGKVPVWSFNEVIDPTFNVPLGLMSKELAAKLNQKLFGAAISDAQVDALAKKIEAAGKAADFNDVYALGFGNNPRAVPALVKLTDFGDDDVAHAAISSLGLLRANEQLPLLTKAFENDKTDWEDRAIALKAICDLDGAAAKAYMQKTEASLADKSDRAANLFKAIIALYK